VKTLSQDTKHAKVTLEEKGVVREETPPESPPLPVPHRVSA
jgi:hypothetical protein